MIRFTPARTYLTASAVAFGMAAFSAWCAVAWLPAAIPAILFTLSASFVLWLGVRPAIEVREADLRVGGETIAWEEIRRVDQTGWISPMVAYLTLADGEKIRLLYPGETEQSNRLLRMIQQRAIRASINGVPHRQIFGDPPKEASPAARAPKYRLLTEEDEAEVEALYRKLRAAGRLDPEK